MQPPLPIQSPPFQVWANLYSAFRLTFLTSPHEREHTGLVFLCLTCLMCLSSIYLLKWQDVTLSWRLNNALLCVYPTCSLTIHLLFFSKSEHPLPSLPLDIPWEPGWLDHMVDSFFFSWGRSILFSIVAVLIYILTNSVKHGQIWLFTLSTILSVKVEKNTKLDVRRSGLYSHLLSSPAKESWLHDTFYLSLSFLIYIYTVISYHTLPSLTWNKKSNYDLHKCGGSLGILLTTHHWWVLTLWNTSNNYK